MKDTFTKMGRLDVMCQNPANAVIHLGHSKGTVTMWTPNMQVRFVFKDDVGSHGLAGILAHSIAYYIN